MTKTNLTPQDIETLNALVKDYFALIFKRFDALVATFLLGYISLYLLSVLVTSSGIVLALIIPATIATIAACWYSQFVWAKAQ